MGKGTAGANTRAGCSSQQTQRSFSLTNKSVETMRRSSLAAAVAAYERGATIFRVHDVREHVEALTVAAAVG